MLNIENFLKELGLIVLSGVWGISITSMNDGFSWSGLGVFICGILLVFTILSIRNWDWNFDKQTKRKNKK